MPAASGVPNDARKYDGSRDPESMATTELTVAVEARVPSAAPDVLGSRTGTGNSVNPRPWICSCVKV